MILIRPFFSLTIFLVLTNLGFSQVSSTAPFSADYISVNQAGSVWAFGNGAQHGKGLYYDFNGWKFVEYNLTDGVKAASSVYGEILIVNNSGNIKEWNTNNKRWLNYAGITDVKDAFISKRNGNQKIALGTVKQSDGTSKSGVWKVDNISVNASSWTEVLTDSWAKQFIKATNDSNGNLYFVTSSGRLMARYANDTRYNDIDTQGKFVIDVLVGENGTLYMVERGGKIYRRDVENWYESRLSASSFGVDDKGVVYGVINKEILKVEGTQVSKITVENPNQLDGNGNTPLTAAIGTNDRVAAQKAIDKGTNVNLANGNGDTPIIMAIRSRNSAMVSLLVDNKADLTIKDKEGHTPLYYAVQTQDKSLTQAVLLSDVDPNLEDVITPLVLLKNSEMILLLSNYKADLTPGLNKSAELNDTEMFKNLIQYGGKLSSNESFNMAVDRDNQEIAKMSLQNGAEKNSAMKYAVQKENKGTIIICLENGANAEPAIDYVLAKKDIEFTNALITNHKVSADKILERAVSENRASPQATNLPIATVALQNGAKPDPYIPSAVQDKNTQLVELLLINGGSANKLLTEAVKTNNNEYVNLAFDNGAEVSKASNLVLSAIEKNQIETIQILVNNGLDVKNKKFIKEAVTRSNLQLTKLFLENGAPTEDNDLTQTAVTNNKEAIVQELLNFGANPNSSIQLAADKNYTKMVIMMLEAGAVATTPKLIATASSKGNVEVVTALLVRGASPDEGVLSAINSSKVNVFNLLMDNGANNQKVEYVIAAVRRNQLVIFKYLMDKNAPVAYKGQNNENLLHISCANASYDISDILIRKGVDVNEKNTAGLTPLHVAVKTGRNNVNLASLLVDNGANVNAKDNKGKSILKYADGKKLKDYLKSKGASK